MREDPDSSVWRRLLGVKSIRRVLLLVWICFLLRGFFYSSLFPLWEGYDEWAHFAFVEYLVTNRELPISTQTRASRAVEESLRLLPLPWELRDPPHLAHDAYWKLAPEEREQLQQRLDSLPAEWASEPANGRLLIYEGLQPPAYYWLLSWPMRAMAGTSLPARVVFLRYLSVILASLVIPLGFLTARHVFGDDRLALGVVTLVAAMPELMIDVSRVGNESLAIVLYSLLVYSTLKLVDNPDQVGRASSLGVTLGLGLITKAYFLTALPALAIIFAWCLWSRPTVRMRVFASGSLAVALATLLSGWWYWRNLLLTGTYSGLSESISLRDVPLFHLLQRVPQVNWRNAFDSVLLSHIWFGNWSSLQVRSWMYHFFMYVVLLAALGLIILVWRVWRKPTTGGFQSPQTGQLVVLVSFYGFFWLGQAYNVLLIFASKGASTSMGWYMYCLVVAEVVLVTIGLYTLLPARFHPWVLPLSTACFAALELYATHFLLVPYYTGLIAHKANGHLSVFHISQVRETGFVNIFQRLLINKPGFLSLPVLLVLWLLFLSATVGLVALGHRCAARR